MRLENSLTFQSLIYRSLTLGLMGLDELHLRVLATSSEDLTEKNNAKKGTHLEAPICVAKQGDQCFV